MCFQPLLGCSGWFLGDSPSKVHSKYLSYPFFNVSLWIFFFIIQNWAQQWSGTSDTLKLHTLGQEFIRSLWAGANTPIITQSMHNLTPWPQAVVAHMFYCNKLSNKPEQSIYVCLQHACVCVTVCRIKVRTLRSELLRDSLQGNSKLLNYCFINFLVDSYQQL